MHRKSMLFIPALLIASLVLISCGQSAPAPTAAPVAKPATSAPAAATAAPAAPTAAPAPASAATPAASSAAPAQVITWKYGTYNPETGINSLNATWWMNEITKRSNGRLKFQPYWAGSLFKAGEELDAMRKRVADVGTVAVQNYPGELVLSNIASLVIPFGPNDAGMEMQIVGKLFQQFPEMNQEWEKNNIKRLFSVGSSSYGMYSMKALKSVDDLKGEKVMALGKWMPRYPQAAGATVLNIPASDHAMSLKTGVATSGVFPLEYTYSFGNYKVVKYAINTNFGAAVWAQVVVNMDSWKALPADLQTIVSQVSVEAEAELADRVKKMITGEALDAITKEGGAVTDFPQVEIAKWANLMPNSPADFAQEANAKGLPGTAIVKAYLSTAESLGFKWARDWTKGLP